MPTHLFSQGLSGETWGFPVVLMSGHSGVSSHLADRPSITSTEPCQPAQPGETYSSRVENVVRRSFFLLF